MTTLADKAILSGADNRPPMMEKDMYDSWKSIMQLYMINRQHGRMILEFIKNGPLIWPSIEENRVTRPKKYSELSATEVIQVGCDIKATNIILQGLPPEVYALERGCKLYDEFDKFAYKKGKHYRGDDPIDAINHVMSFLSAVVTSRYPTTNNQLRNSSNPRQQTTINDGSITLQPVQGRQISFASSTSRTYTPGACRKHSGKPRDCYLLQCKGEGHYPDILVGSSPHRMSLLIMLLSKANDWDAYDLIYNNMINQAMQAMPSSEQSNVVNHSETKITSDSNIIPYSHAIVIPNSEETLMLAEEGRSKMLLKQKDPMMLEKKVNTTPVDYANSMNSSDPTLSSRPTKVEVPIELPKVSMVNTSLKKLKHHLAGFDVVVKERTTAIAITRGSWGFEHTKAYFRDEIIPFVKALKDLFNTFDQYLIDELSKVQNVFNQMEQAVEQHNIVNIIMNSSMDNASVNVHKCEKCLKLETGILNKKDFIEKETYDKLDNSVLNQSAPSFDQYFEFNEMKAQSQEKDTIIKKLKEKIKSLSENMNEDKIKKDIEEIETINIELDHRVSNLIAENKHLNLSGIRNS
ncbi:hypothetical protein Tco_1456995 [Tanacetum coccineum]